VRWTCAGGGTRLRASRRTSIGSQFIKSVQAGRRGGTFAKRADLHRILERGTRPTCTERQVGRFASVIRCLTSEGLRNECSNSVNAVRRGLPSAGEACRRALRTRLPKLVTRLRPDGGWPSITYCGLRAADCGLEHRDVIVVDGVPVAQRLEQCLARYSSGHRADCRGLSIANRRSWVRIPPGTPLLLQWPWHDASTPSPLLVRIARPVAGRR
jgi:hypothetical protein